MNTREDYDYDVFLIQKKAKRQPLLAGMPDEAIFESEAYQYFKAEQEGISLLESDFYYL